MEQVAANDATPDDIKSDEVKFAACMLRLEGHDLMDFRREFKRGRNKNSWKAKGNGGKKLSGGSDGCVNFEDPDNAGLPTCLAWTNINTIYNNWCDKLSLADFMVIAGEVVVGKLAVDYNSEAPFEGDTLLSMFRD